MDPHATDNTDYTWILKVAFHLHAFLLTVLSFRMIPLHFCPVHFHSSFMMHYRGCLLHAAFLILPTSFHFTFPRTLSFCSTMGAPHFLPFILAIRVHVFPTDPEGKHQVSFILTASAKHCLLLVMCSPLTSFTSRAQLECRQQWIPFPFSYSTNIYLVSGFLVAVYYRNE